MTWFRRVGWFAASVVMGLRWKACDYWGHPPEDVLRYWHWDDDVPGRSGVYTRCLKCYRMVEKFF